MIPTDAWAVTSQWVPHATARAEIPPKLCAKCVRPKATAFCVLCSRAWCSSCDVLAVEPGALSTTPPEGSDPTAWHYGTYELVLCFCCSEELHSTGRAALFKAHNPATGVFVSTLRVLAPASAVSQLKRCAAHAELLAKSPLLPPSDDDYPAKRSPTEIALERQASEFALSLAEGVLAECPPSISVAAVLDAGKRAFKKKERARRLSVYPVSQEEAEEIKAALERDAGASGSTTRPTIPSGSRT